jgi:hypothetical protein
VLLNGDGEAAATAPVNEPNGAGPGAVVVANGLRLGLEKGICDGAGAAANGEGLLTNGDELELGSPKPPVCENEVAVDA